jgi:hypothetical protein
MFRTTLLAVMLVLTTPADSLAAQVSDSEIRQLLIDQSIATYSGNCPCPYNVDRAGRACGKRSAYSKPGGYAPLCYPSDITDEMIAEYRRANAGS